ncbi:hypothetical protein ARMGADRAFT_159854 [Armillaria gallica]|uniref:Secreted protein n=1 Tax=Armillaria gallica TaxID=47427 RepID=A0A2H3DF45_ARMGA|nr:hypothetical protein ARMGADRAFT_159854 [Armillaria gallica]
MAEIACVLITIARVVMAIAPPSVGAGIGVCENHPGKKLNVQKNASGVNRLHCSSVFLSVHISVYRLEDLGALGPNLGAKTCPLPLL